MQGLQTDCRFVGQDELAVAGLQPLSLQAVQPRRGLILFTHENQQVTRTGQADIKQSEFFLHNLACGGLTDFKYTRNVVTPSKIATLDALKAAIIAGKIVVPSTREELASFTRVPL